MAGNFTPQQIAQMRQMQQIYQSPQFQNNAPAPFQHQANAVLNWLGLTGPNSVGHQLVQTFDPTTKAGAANILTSIFGGGDFIGEGGLPLENPGMPGSYERYSPTKASLGNELGWTHEGQPHQTNYAIKAANKGVKPGRYGDWTQFVHDIMFGGEAHTKGPIPRRAAPKINRKTEQEQALQDMQDLQSMLDKSNAHQARQRAMAKVLHEHGIDPSMAHASEFEHQTHDPTYTRKPFRGDKNGPGLHKYGAGKDAASVAKRQAILRRFYARQAHNHRN